jgi:hypothetical protein
MMIEIMGIATTLRRWKASPEAPACELSVFSCDQQKNRQFRHQEILEMKRVLKRHAPTTHEAIFHDQTK